MEKKAVALANANAFHVGDSRNAISNRPRQRSASGAVRSMGWMGYLTISNRPRQRSSAEQSEAWDGEVSVPSGTLPLSTVALAIQVAPRFMSAQVPKTRFMS